MQDEFIQIEKNNKLKLTFTDKKVTAYGGFSIMAHLLKKLRFQQAIEQAIPFVETSPNGTGVFAKVLRLGLTVLAGGKRFTHSCFLGDSMEIYEELFEVERIPVSTSALTRFFERFDNWKITESLSESLWNWTAEKLIPFGKIKEDFIGFDSSVLTRYGDQQGAAKGYNPKKPGRNSHHPISAFLTESNFVVNLWNRPGNVNSRNNCIEFAKQTFARLGGKLKILGLLCDSGFYEVWFLEFLESYGLGYIIAAVLSPTLQRQITKITSWSEITSGIHGASFYFQHEDEKWKAERRYVVIRKDLGLRPEATGKQLCLFGNDVIDTKYVYSVYITSFDWEEGKIWEQYKRRAGDENIYREMKQDFAFEGFTCDGFWATEAAMVLRVLFYNIIQFLRANILKDKEAHFTLHTLRHKILVMPAILGRQAKWSVLRLGVRLEKKRERIRSIFKAINCYFDQPQCN